MKKTPAPTKKRTRAPAHQWAPLGVGSRCSICRVERRPERKARTYNSIVMRYYDAEGNDLGRVAPKCLTGHERQESLLDPARFE